MGEITPFLLWFKTKVMKVVTPRTWQPFHQCPNGYYNKYTVIDEATGLWVLHFKYRQNPTKKKKLHTTDNSTLTSEGLHEQVGAHKKYDDHITEGGSISVLATVTATNTVHKQCIHGDNAELVYFQCTRRKWSVLGVNFVNNAKYS